MCIHICLYPYAYIHNLFLYIPTFCLSISLSTDLIIHLLVCGWVSVSVCIRIYIYTHTCIHIHVYMRLSMYACLYITHMHACGCMCAHNDLLMSLLVVDAVVLVGVVGCAQRSVQENEPCGLVTAVGLVLWGEYKHLSTAPCARICQPPSEHGGSKRGIVVFSRPLFPAASLRV